VIKAFWFNNDQTEADILQPEFFTPKTQLEIRAQLPNISFPVKVNVDVFCLDHKAFSKSYVVDKYETEGNIVLADFPETLETNPDRIEVEICDGTDIYAESICCTYATISGKISDFFGCPFPAAVIYNFDGFTGTGNGIGTWSDAEGNYTITLPCGEYNSIFVDDNSYGQRSLEAWGWKMIVDADETHDYKIGNGEVYSLDLWANNGGFQTLFIAFRAMVLSYALKGDVDSVDINGKAYSAICAAPEITLDDISVQINGCKVDNISLQKIFETGADGQALPMYILQTTRPYGCGKQTLVLEYDFVDANGEAAQSQGRTQFYYAGIYGLAVR